MEEETYLEFYLDPCAAQDDLAPPVSPLFNSAIPYDVYGVDPPNPGHEFNSHLRENKEPSGDFSSVDLSFLPDEFTQENKDQTIIKNKREVEENCKTPSPQNGLPLPSDEGAGPGLSSSSPPSDADQLQPSPEKRNSDASPLASIAPMEPMNPVSESSGIVPQLQNIVSTVNLACKLDLKKIALHAKNAEYNPKRFAAVIMRIREPRTTALVFSSGKMVCTGARSEEQSRLAARKYARVVQKLGFPARFLDFKIQNMVGSCDVRFPIRLEGLVLTHRQFSRVPADIKVCPLSGGGYLVEVLAGFLLEGRMVFREYWNMAATPYEPELFPGLIYRMVKPRIVLLIFVSGKVVLTGAKERSEIYEAFENIYPILKGFKKA